MRLGQAQSYHTDAEPLDDQFLLAQVHGNGREVGILRQ